jgi:hypothetical protein
VAPPAASETVGLCRLELLKVSDIERGDRGALLNRRSTNQQIIRRERDAAPLRARVQRVTAGMAISISPKACPMDVSNHVCCSRSAAMITLESYRATVAL